MSDGGYVLSGLFGTHRQELVNHVPHARELGMVVEYAGPRECIVRLPVDERLVGDRSRGVVFGGVITTLLDQVGGACVMSSLDELVPIATIDLRIDYMKPATPGRDLVGRAECYRLTRNVAFVRGEAYHDDRSNPFAIFLSTYMLSSNRKQSGLAERVREVDGNG